MKHVSRWEKAARKMVKVDKHQSPAWASEWRVTYPSCAAPRPDTHISAYYPTRYSARQAANKRIESLTKILQQASKLAGF